MTPQRWHFFLDAKTFLDFGNPWNFFFTRKEAEWYRRDREKAGRRCAKKRTRAIKREKEQREGKRTQKKEGMRHLLREVNFIRIWMDSRTTRTYNLLFSFKFSVLMRAPTVILNNEKLLFFACFVYYRELLIFRIFLNFCQTNRWRGARRREGVTPPRDSFDVKRII